MSMIKEKLKATGKVNFKLYDKEGNLKEEHNINNLVVTTGLEYIAARMVESGRPAQMSHMAVGESSATPDLAQDSLGDETEREALNPIGGTALNNTVTYSATFPAGVESAITEAGIFNSDTAGDMLCRTTFAVINKASADTLAVVWEITIS